MAGFNVEHINPFLVSGTKILKEVCGFETTVGKPYLAAMDFTLDTLVIIIGVTGEMKGQVMIAFENNVACEIASKMCMMPVTQMDEMSTSAICELGNMIMGNTATVFSKNGIGIDITPPTVCVGDVRFSSVSTQNICIPIIIAEGKAIKFNVALKGE